MSQFADKTQKMFAKLQEKNSRFQQLTTLQQIKMQTLLEAYFKLRKASEETNKRLKKVLEKKYHCKRDRECMDQEMNKLLNVCRNMRAQSHGKCFGEYTIPPRRHQTRFPVGE
ncbi:hypothetical protein O181_088484 [Austropuccinia psidii MF-1]|uniref:Uncharacterized protein n=1 Tax=Austropuccinia psidii MF-1 TaxID=1389203 RepID=A0A9Q3IRT9_9BASI|nr:hypothetical protein [Austropuccinia psidii MF-1]